MSPIRTMTVKSAKLASLCASHCRASRAIEYEMGPTYFPPFFGSDRSRSYIPQPRVLDRVRYSYYCDSHCAMLSHNILKNTKTCEEACSTSHYADCKRFCHFVRHAGYSE